MVLQHLYCNIVLPVFKKNSYDFGTFEGFSFYVRKKIAIKKITLANLLGY